MTPALIIALLEAAVKVGLAVPEIIGWAKQQHPELADPPPPDAEDSLGAEAEVLIERRWPTPREAADRSHRVRVQKPDPDEPPKGA